MLLGCQARFFVTIIVVVMHTTLLGQIALSEEISCDSQSNTLYESKVKVTATLSDRCMNPIGYYSILESATPIDTAPSQLVESDDQTPADINDATLDIQIYSSVRSPDYLRISTYGSASNSLRSPISFYECFGERITYTDTEPMCNLRYVTNEGERSMKVSFELDDLRERDNCMAPGHCVLLVEAVWLPGPVQAPGPLATDHQWWQLPFSMK